MGLFSWFRRKRPAQNTSNSSTAQLSSSANLEPAAAPYMMPADMQEVNRLDFQHFMLRQALQSNYVAPIGRPKSILDVACGTGRWAHEMATTFPEASVVGLDLVVQTADTTGNFIPGNYAFVQGNILNGLPFADSSFDFVHQRLLVVGLPAAKWQDDINELVRVTRPGGWVELVEAEIMMQNAGPATRTLANWAIEASKTRGIDPSQTTNIGKFLNNAGLVNMQTRTIPLPVGNWGGRIGNMVAKDMYAGNRGIKPLVLAQLGVSSDEYDHLTDMELQEWESMRSSFVFLIAYGQRPM